jgi:hypothetical protein
MGGCLGLSYTLGELPNSFLKRRMGIEPGITLPGFKGLLFSLYDQTDSVLGGVLCMPLYWTPPLSVALEILLFCSLVHAGCNGLYLALKLKKRF